MNNRDQLLFFSRLLLLLFGVFSPVSGMLNHYLYPVKINDPLELRIVFSFFCFMFFSLTFFYAYFKTKSWNLFQIIFLLFSMQITYLTYVNEWLYVFLVTLPILWVVSPHIYRQKWEFFIFMFLNGFLGLGLLFFLDNNSNNDYFITLLAIAIPSSLLTYFYLISYVKTLEFSNELVNNIDAIVIVSNPQGEITFISENVKRILGYSREELMGRGWWDMRNEKTIDDDDLKRMVQELKISTSNMEGNDSPIIHQNGSKLWMHWRDILLPNGDILGVAQDITSKKQVEDELVKLSYIARETDNLVLLVDDNYIVEWVNPGFVNATGLNENEVIGFSVNAFLSDASLGNSKTLSQILENCKKSKEFNDEEISFINAKGDELRVQFSLNPILEDDKILRIVCLGKDVTEKYKLQKQKEIHQERSEILQYLDRKIFKAESLDLIFLEVVEHVYQLKFNIKRVSIAIFNFDESIANLIYSDSISNKEICKGSYPLEDSSNTISILKNAEFAIYDLTKEKLSSLTQTQRKLFIEHGVGCYISLPIKYKDELVGCINFAAENDSPFTEEIVEFLKELSSDISMAVYQFKLKDAIEQKNLRLEEKNKDITDSINYARLIQQAVLPTFDIYKNAFKDVFTFFEPKDTLSGDVFLIEETDDKLWIACVDCTGHGVPGALVSLVGINILNQAIFEKKLNYPNEVLSFLNENVIKTLHNSSEDGISDGMDIAICCVDKKSNKLYYSGVMNNLLYVRGKELLECSSIRVPIGMKINRKSADFEMHEIKIQKDDKFYIFTDGFPDQFGGEKNKKFGMKRFKKLLLDISDYPMSEQNRVISNSFALWKLDTEQTDDVLVLGFKL